LPCFDRFEIDIISALSGQLISAFAGLEIGPLSEDQLGVLPGGQGVYQLHFQERLVYVGKADNLPKRLSEHRRKIIGRQNINIADVGFTCLFVHPNWTALAPEESLIKYYRDSGTGVCPWNGNGFGPHDPGREREETDKSPDGFDAMYPIREDWRCDWVKAGEHNAAQLLKSLKSGLPYLLRYQTARKQSQEAHPDYRGARVTVPEDNMSASDVLRAIARALPGWQATRFPGHMILYKERHKYRHGHLIWPV
jgi:predicted GIY-YIG superfamily endonuclease